MTKVALQCIESKDVQVGVDAKTGFIRSLIFKKNKVDLFQQLRQNIPGYVSQVRVYDELDSVWYNGLLTTPIIKKFKKVKNSIQYELTFKGCPFTLTVALGFEKEFLRWSVVGQKINKKVANRSLRVVFDMPIIAGWDFWAPCSEGQFTYDGMTSFDFNHIQVSYVSPHDIILPMVTHYNKKLDVGFSMMEPMGAQVPAARFQCLNADKNFNWGAMEKPIETIPTLEVMNYYIGLVDNRPMETEVQLCFHEGDWRPAVGKVYQKWQEYFDPISEVIYDYLGVFNCGCADDAKKSKLLKEMKTTTYEVHGHFEFYGDYFQDGKDDWINLDTREGYFRREFKNSTVEEQIKFFETHTDEEITEIFTKHVDQGVATPGKKQMVIKPRIRNYRAQIKKELIEFRKNGIGPYWYFNYTDGYKPFVEKNFADSIAKNEDGTSQPSGWFFCHNMNADPRFSFGKHMIASAKKILKEYPQLTGFFLDCFRHFEVDFAHDDGITVVNNKPAYSMNFSYDAIEKYIKTKVMDPKKHASFSNKPQSIRSMRYVDGVLLEGDGSIAEAKFFWTCIAKPLFFMWTSNHETLDFNLKRAIYSGCYPRFDFSKVHGSEAEIKKLSHKYLPLYEAFERRVFCFEADPMRVPKGNIGQLFTVGKDYVASVINENIGTDDMIQWSKTPYAAFRVAKAHDVGKVLIRYPGSKWESVKFQFDGTFIFVPMSKYKNCAVVKLEVTKKTGKKIGVEMFKAGVDYCGDPSSSFEDITTR